MAISSKKEASVASLNAVVTEDFQAKDCQECGKECGTDFQGRVKLDADAEPAQYIALYRATVVRDVQIYKADPAAENIDLHDYAWADHSDAEVYIGLFSGHEADIISAVVAREGCHADAIRLIAVK